MLSATHSYPAATKQKRKRRRKLQLADGQEGSADCRTLSMQLQLFDVLHYGPPQNGLAGTIGFIDKRSGALSSAKLVLAVQLALLKFKLPMEGACPLIYFIAGRAPAIVARLTTCRHHLALNGAIESLPCSWG